MMMKTLTGRLLYEKRWFLAGWSVAFGVMSALVMLFYPSFSEGGGFDEIAKTLPSQLQGFIGDPSVFRTIDGFIASQVFDVRMSLMVIIMTLVLAVGLTVREEEEGGTRTILMTSQSRSRMTFEKLFTASIIVSALILAAIAGVYIGLIGIGEPAPHAFMWKLYALTCLFGVVTFSIPFAVALATGSRSLTLFIGLIVALGSYILSTFARSVDWLKEWEMLSLIHYYDTTGVREGTFSMTNLWVFALVLVVSVTIGTLVFRQRDIA